ncbi:zinc transport system substrate-binding protein [Bacteroides zoogleoformans]|uniref:Zinc ABC transporter substrate-binding protein n=1 Tax=Bacteroides zoogleoformans TaxID=28119 RepID=A0ABN5IJI8_9BACE|nr:zinc ABC transporter substrate-binding protein [Bacteroides zoogleoformans]AVM53057.1 zinc ABC transporter substrate-binding protein [Bacteroides zoogleoformans]TWJ13154.1 zinc transport system substrate-binding protein [Bacteroides zoogleoformans]
MKKVYSLFLIAVLLLACKQANRQTDKNDGKPIITVTIEPLRYFTEAIAGDKFSVVSMVPKGMSPETYDPTPGQLVDLAKSKAYFRIGYIGFELTWIEKLTDNAPHLHFYDMSKGVELISDDSHAHRHDEGDNHTHAAHDHASGIEPHIWNSATNAQLIAGNILHALCTLDKENEAFYTKRYQNLIRKIEHTDDLVCQMLSAGNADRAFMIYHPALSYFARDYDLRQIPIEASGKEPSPAHLKELIKTCKAEKVRIIFIQPEFDRRNAELIARQTGTQVVSINPLSYDWEEEMLNVAKSLSSNSAETARE